MNKRLASLLALLGIHQHLSAEQKQDLATAAFQSAPGAAPASSAGAVGLPLSDILVLASIAFVALQAGYLVWKWRCDARRDQERQGVSRRGRPVETDPGSLGGRRVSVNLPGGAAMRTALACKGAVPAVLLAALASPLAYGTLESLEGNIKQVYSGHLAGGLPTYCAGRTDPAAIVGTKLTDDQCREVSQATLLGYGYVVREDCGPKPAAVGGRASAC